MEILAAKISANASGSPLVDHVGPVLQHRRALLAVLSLVVDGPHALLLVRQALLNPVGVIAGFM